jgi:hypothetical protein
MTRLDLTARLLALALVAAVAGPAVSSDLTVSRVVVRPATAAPGDTLAVTVIVRNQGDTPSPPASGELWLEGHAGGPGAAASLGRFAIDALETRTALTLSLDVVVPAVPAGSYRLVASVDGEDAVNEANEGNNERAAALKVVRSTLAVARLSAYPGVALAGGSVRLAFKVKNRGPVGTGPTSVALVLGPTPTAAPPEGTLLLTLGVEALAAGASRAYEVDVPVPIIESGLYYLVARPEAWSAVNRSQAVRLRVETSPMAGLVPVPPLVVDGEEEVVIQGVRVVNPEGPCVIIGNAARVVLRDSDIGPCRGSAIWVWRSHEVVIANSFIHTERSGDEALNGGLGVFVQGGSEVLIQGNRFLLNESGVYVREGARDVRVIGNYLANPLGPFPRGQHVQFDGVQDGEISDNYGVAERGASRQEDAINLFRSQRVRVAGNYLEGGDATHGCGIITDGGQGQDRGHVIEGNVIIRTGQCGIGIAGGTDHVVRGNRVLDTSIPGGAGNTGIYVWNQYPGACHGHLLEGNIVSNRRPDGSFSDFWDGQNCGLTLRDNVFGSRARALLTPEAEKLPPPPIPPRQY